jgi:hypothetical protein
MRADSGEEEDEGDGNAALSAGFSTHALDGDGGASKRRIASSFGSGGVGCGGLSQDWRHRPTSLSCLLKLYDDTTQLKLNDVFEAIGVLEADPAASEFSLIEARPPSP